MVPMLKGSDFMTKIPPKPVRIVVAGCGSMSHAWISYALARDDCRIVGLVDPNPEALSQISRQYGLSEAMRGSDLSEVIRKTNANLVFCLAVPSAHDDIAMTAFCENCAVMSEKPLAENMTQAHKMIAAAKEKNLFFAVMQNRRYLRQIRSCRALIEKGLIGQPGYMGADFFLGPHFGGFREFMDSPLLLDMAIHTFDQARFLLNAKATSVYCHEFNPPGSWYQGNAAAVSIFTMDDGTVFCYRGSWCAIGCETSWESEWRITGSRGTLRWDGHGMPWAEILPQEEASADPEKASFIHIDGPEVWHGREGHEGCLDALFSALFSGQPAETQAEDNQYSLAMVMGAIESSRTGQKIQL